MSAFCNFVSHGTVSYFLVLDINSTVSLGMYRDRDRDRDVSGHVFLSFPVIARALVLHSGTTQR